jgi:hypothetical protein
MSATDSHDLSGWMLPRERRQNHARSPLFLLVQEWRGAMSQKVFINPHIWPHIRVARISLVLTATSLHESILSKPSAT